MPRYLFFSILQVVSPTLSLSLSLSLSHSLSLSLYLGEPSTTILPHHQLQIRNPIPNTPTSTKHSMASQQQSLEAWEFNPTDEDPRFEHKFSPNRPVPAQCLEDLGVLSWKIDVELDWNSDPLVEKIKLARGYNSWDTVTVAPGKLDNYDDKIKQFFTEHLHPYDESRLILDGCGYWDIRGYAGEWIRFRVEKGDMIVLPPGMYHRFTLDNSNYIKAVLLFTETPTRIDVMRPQGDDLQVRKDYVASILLKGSSNRSISNNHK